jgi:hypothetical protein
MFFPAADTIAFAEGGTEAMRIDSSGNLLVGTTSPLQSSQLTVYASPTPITTIDRTTNIGATVSCASSGTGYIQGGVRLGTEGNSGIYGYDDGTSGAQGIGIFTGNNTTIAERMRIPSTGGIQSVNCVSVGNATPSTSGAGITFPATQSASTDANTLDDYEEGTWTPVISNAGTDVGATYLYRSGRYVKIGNTVWVSFGFRLSGVGSGGSLNIYINGLPFAANTYGAYQEPATAGAAGNLNNAANAVMVRYYPAGSGSTLIFTRLANGGDTQWLYNDLTSTSFLSAQLSYTV